MDETRTKRGCEGNWLTRKTGAQERRRGDFKNGTGCPPALLEAEVVRVQSG
jgi:hypothetical protein